MPKVSVVLPVHNVEEYLRQCLDSLLNQILQDIEIICVDDGSTDGSPAILAEYAAAHSRIKVIRQANGGAGAARNAGMSVASGEWLFFSDADDYSGAEMLERMTTADGAGEADVVVAGHRTLDSGRLTTERLPARLIKDHDTPAEACRPWLFLDAGVMPWNKLFRRSFVQSRAITFQTTMKHNDVRFICCALAAAGRIAVSNTCGYVYRRGRSGGITHSSSPTQDGRFPFITVLASLRQELTRMGLIDKAAVAYANLALAHCYYHLLGNPDAEAFSALYAELHGHILADLGLKDAVESTFVNRKHYGYMAATLSDETPVSLWMLLLKERYDTWRDLCTRAERIATLQKGASDAERQIKAAQSEIAGLEQTKARLQSDCDERSRRIDELAQEAKARDARIAELADSSKRLQSLLDVSERARADLSQRLAATLGSWSYRIGRFATWPFRAMRDLFSRG